MRVCSCSVEALRCTYFAGLGTQIAGVGNRKMCSAKVEKVMSDLSEDVGQVEQERQANIVKSSP